MSLTIVVKPSGGGWFVAIDGLVEAMFFDTSGSAKSVARDLAERIAQIIGGVEVEIHNGAGDVVGRFSHFPDSANDNRPIPLDAHMLRPRPI